MSATGTPAHAPTDPGDALRQLLDAADGIVADVRGAFARWREDYPHATFSTDWDRACREWMDARGRVASWQSLEMDLGWFGGSNPEHIHRNLREAFREAGNRIPQATDWHENPVIVRWRALIRPAADNADALHGLNLIALEMVGAFPDSHAMQIQKELNWLLGSCACLVRFTPIDFTSPRPFDPGALRAAVEEAEGKLRALTCRVVSDQQPLRALLAMYRGKQRQWGERPRHGDISPAERSQKNTQNDALRTTLHNAIIDKRNGGLSESQIVAFIASPEGKSLRELVEEELKRSPMTRQKPKQKRSVRHVVRAALKPTYSKDKPPTHR